MSEQLLEVLSAVREAIDIPAAAGSDAARKRGVVLAVRVRQAMPVLRVCLSDPSSSKVQEGLTELREWLANNPPYGYVTAEQKAAAAARPNGECWLPVGSLLPRMGVYVLAKLWLLNYRTVRTWVDVGMLPHVLGKGGMRVITREAAIEFAGNLAHVRTIRPGTTVRHAEWDGGRPVRIEETSIVEPKWRVVYRTAEDTVYCPPLCSGDRMVLIVPPSVSPSPTSDSPRKDPA